MELNRTRRMRRVFSFCRKIETENAFFTRKKIRFAEKWHFFLEKMNEL